MAQSKRSRITRESQVLNKERAKKGQIQPDAPEDYEPFLSIHDFSSRGRSSRTRSGDRVQHLMSDLEVMCLRELQWNQNVIHVYEQVLLNREKTVAIAREMGIEHPHLSGDGKPYPMTTDLVVEIAESGMIRTHAIAIKPAEDVDMYQLDRKNPDKTRRQLSIERTIDKLEIERRYWTKLEGASWSLVTDAVLSKVRKNNIETFLSTNEPERREPHDYWKVVSEYALRAIRTYPNRLISTITRGVEQRYEIPPADFLFALRYLCKQRYLDFDLNAPFGPECHGRDFKLADRSREARRFGKAA